MFFLKQLINLPHLRTIEELFNAAPNGALLRKRSDGASLEYTTEKTGLLGSASTPNLPIAHTGTTAETTIHTFTLPANLLTLPGQHTEILFYVARTGGGGNTNWRIRTSTSTQLLSISNTFGTNAYNRRLDYLNASTLATPPITASISDGTNIGALLEVPFDWTVNQTLTLTCQLANTTDIATLRLFRVRVFT